MYRLFITLNNDNTMPFREAFVSHRHAEAGIIAIQEKGGLEVYDAEQKYAGKLPLKSIRRFDICRAGSDGSIMPSTLIKTF